MPVALLREMLLCHILDCSKEFPLPTKIPSGLRQHAQVADDPVRQQQSELAGDFATIYATAFEAGANGRQILRVDS